jgi:hypothetical protein
VRRVGQHDGEPLLQDVEQRLPIVPKRPPRWRGVFTPSARWR